MIDILVLVIHFSFLSLWFKGVSATQFWYSAVSKYDQEGEASEEGTSFTQIVWKGSKEVGFGISRSSDGTFFFVAEYLPSGNIRGEYESNVFQLTDEFIRAASITSSKASLIKKLFSEASFVASEPHTKDKNSNSTQQTTHEIRNISALMTSTKSSSKVVTTTASRPLLRFTSYANKVHILFK